MVFPLHIIQTYCNVNVLIDRSNLNRKTQQYSVFLSFKKSLQSYSINFSCLHSRHLSIHHSHKKFFYYTAMMNQKFLFRIDNLHLAGKTTKFFQILFLKKTSKMSSKRSPAQITSISFKALNLHKLTSIRNSP